MRQGSCLPDLTLRVQLFFFDIMAQNGIRVQIWIQPLLLPTNHVGLWPPAVKDDTGRRRDFFVSMT